MAKTRITQEERRAAADAALRQLEDAVKQKLMPIVEWINRHLILSAAIGLLLIAAMMITELLLS